MKIALICSDKGPCPPIRGGAIQLLISRVAPLLAKKHEVTVYSIGDPDLSDRESFQGVWYERFPSKRFFGNVCKRIAKEDFDVIQVYNRPAWVSSFRALAPKAVIILSLHNTLLDTLKVSQKEAASSIRHSDQILTVSRFVAKDTMNKFPEARGKIQVVYTGVDLKEYSPVWSNKGQKWRREIRKRYRIGDNDPVLLFVGRLVSYKGSHVVVHALKQILKTNDKVKLLIVGSKWYADNEMDSYIKDLFRLALTMNRHVIFTSYVPVDEIPKYYAAADVFICASQWQEPLARVHYEAMASGLPIITTRRGGNHEVVVEGGNGLLIRNYTDPSKFAKSVNHLLAHRGLARKMGQMGRELAERIYNFERVANDLEEMYQSLSDNKKGRGGE